MIAFLVGLLGTAAALGLILLAENIVNDIRARRLERLEREHDRQRQAELEADPRRALAEWQREFEAAHPPKPEKTAAQVYWEAEAIYENIKQSAIDRYRARQADLANTTMSVDAWTQMRNAANAGSPLARQIEEAERLERLFRQRGGKPS